MCDTLCPFDVALLTRLIATGEHNDNYISSAREIEPVTRTYIDAQFRHLSADGFPVTQVAEFDLSKTRGDACLGSTIIVRASSQS